MREDVIRLIKEIAEKSSHIDFDYYVLADRMVEAVNKGSFNEVKPICSQKSVPKPIYHHGQSKPAKQWLDEHGYCSGKHGINWDVIADLMEKYVNYCKASPKVYPDPVEAFCKHIKHLESQLPHGTIEGHGH